jgi:predicted Abi (CAAX) family protease
VQSRFSVTPTTGGFGAQVRLEALQKVGETGRSFPSILMLHFDAINMQVVQNNIVDAFSLSAVNPTRVILALGISIVVTAVLVLPFVILSGFAKRENRASRADLPIGVKLHALVGTFFMPGLLEESVYRAAMLPRLVKDYSAVAPSQQLLQEMANMSLIWQVAGALVIFVGMHPINGLLLRPAACSTFCDWYVGTHGLSLITVSRWHASQARVSARSRVICTSVGMHAGYYVHTSVHHCMPCMDVLLSPCVSLHAGTTCLLQNTR